MSEDQSSTRRGSRFRKFTVALMTGGLLAVSAPAWAATSYYIGDFDYTDYCGSQTFMSVFSGTATHDGTSKVDLVPFKVGARHKYPPCGVSQLCVELRITQHSKGSSSVIATTAPFGTIGAAFDYSKVTPNGRTASFYGIKCTTAATLSVDVGGTQQDSFFWTGGRYALDDYRIETRPRIISRGYYYYGASSSVYKDL